MQDKDLPKLINDYLLGRIQPSELAKLEYLRSINPRIDDRVRQNEEVFRVLKYVRYKEIRQLIHQVDANESKVYKKRIFNAWMAAIFFLFSIVGIWSAMIKHFSPLSIAMRNYENVTATSLFQGEQEEVSWQNWELANQTFKAGEFRVAILEYQSFLENPAPSVAYTAQWNILLARFALAGPTPNWREEIRSFRYAAPEPFKKKAVSLLYLIDSDFYKILIVGVPKKMSSFKPRLL